MGNNLAKDSTSWYRELCHFASKEATAPRKKTLPLAEETLSLEPGCGPYHSVCPDPAI